jgi:antitoxin component HigA of HigAB toxin-antitoxin module
MGDFPPRLISSGAEYDRAAAIVHRLALRDDQLDSCEHMYLDVLELLIEQYDREHHPINIAARKQLRRRRSKF